MLKCDRSCHFLSALLSLFFGGVFHKLLFQGLLVILALALLGVGTAQAGVNSWSTTGPQTGFPDIIVVDPLNPNNILVSMKWSGGMFKSTNGGASWTVLNNASVTEDLAFHPTAANTVFMASNLGVSKSVDGGMNWSALGAFPGSSQSADCVAVDPTNPDTLYAADSYTIYKSTNGGTSWTLLRSDLPEYANDVVVDKSGNVYVATDGAGLLKSTNGGTSWSTMNTGLTSLYVQTLAFDAVNSNTVYAMVGSFSGKLNKSTNGGTSWTSISVGALSSEDVTGFTPDAATSNTIYAGALGTGLFKSTDGGGSWTLMNNGFPSASLIDDLSPWVVASVPGGVVYTGLRGLGIYKSTNSGSTWSAINSGLTAYITEYLYAHPSGTVYTSSNFMGGFRSTDGGGSWTFWSDQPCTGSTTAMAHVPSSPSTVFMGTLCTAIYKSTNGGSSWAASATGIPNYTSVYGFAFDRTNTNNIYAATSVGVYKSTNGGGNWTAAKTGMPTTSKVYGVVIDPTNPLILYAAVDANGVYKTTDGGANWTLVNSGMRSYDKYFSGSGYGSPLAIHPTSPSTLYVSFFYGPVYKSTNGGTTWTTLTSVPTGFRASTVLVDPVTPQTVYVGGAFSGVLKSTDGGSTFSLMNTGLTNNNVTFLEIDPSDPSKLYAGTTGGVYTFAGTGGPRSQVNLNHAASSSTTFATLGTSTPLQAGYGTLSVNSGSVPYATAVFSLTQGGNVVTEAGIPASPPTTQARLFVDYRVNYAAKSDHEEAGVININTGFAAVNKGTAEAVMTLTLRGAGGGTPLAIGSIHLAKDAHMAKFIDQLAPDFVLPGDFGTTMFETLEVSSTQPVSILALRLTSNQRGDTLITTTPIADLTKTLPSGVADFPQFVTGGGYQTSLVVMNTSSSTESGLIRFADDNGAVVNVPMLNYANPQSDYTYNIPAGGFLMLRTNGSAPAVQAGSIRIMPDGGTSTPVGAGVFSYTQGGIMVTESGVPAATLTNHARLYIDRSGSHNTGLAIADTTGASRLITATAYQTDGTTVVGGNSFTLPAYGHGAKFVDQLVSAIGPGFTGVLDISSASPFAALTLRSLNNARGDFLLTTFPIADVTQPAPSPAIFPQIADGGGYQTQFIFLSTSGAATTTLGFYGDAGTPIAVGKREVK